MRLRTALIVLSLVALPSVAFAQATPVTANNGIAFTASPDHNTLDNGTPRLDHYELRFIPGAGGAAVAPVDLAKPAPGAGNLITVDPIAAYGTLTPNVNYTARIFSVGPGGETGSVPTDPFVRVVQVPPAATGKPAVTP